MKPSLSRQQAPNSVGGWRIGCDKVDDDDDDEDDEYVEDDEVQKDDDEVQEDDDEVEDDVVEDVDGENDDVEEDEDDDIEEDDDEKDDNAAEDEVGEDHVAEDEVADDEVEDDDVKGEEDDYVENDDVEKEENDDVGHDDVEEENRSQDRGPYSVRACAVEMHVNMSQEPVPTKIYGKNPTAQIEPRMQTHTLCEPAQSKCTSTFYKSLKCRRPNPRTTLCASLRGRNAFQNFTRNTLDGYLQEKCSGPE